jgi:ribose 5-phosphate isomerase B
LYASAASSKEPRRSALASFAVARHPVKDYVRGMKLAIASDHAGYELKSQLAQWLRAGGHEVADLGTDNAESVDYSDFGQALAEHIAAGKAEGGIALCGTGIGISIAVNRNPQARCARVDEPVSARLAREHNDANVIALGARLIGLDMAKACIEAFLSTPFGGDRHLRRVEKLGKQTS